MGINLSSLMPFMAFLSAVFGVIVIAYFILSRYKFFKMWKDSGLSIFALHPYMGLAYSKVAVDKKKEMSFKGKEFAPKELSEHEKNKAFKDFLTTLPTYCIYDNFFSGMIKKLLERGGARFKKVVLLDPSSVDDVYCTPQVEGDYFVSNGGFYLMPWDNPKTILYWEINDCRPLIEKSKEAKWQDPRMNSRYVYGIMNKISMQGKKEPQTISTMHFIIGCIIIIIVIVAGTYYTDGNMTQVKHTLTNMTEMINQRW